MAERRMFSKTVVESDNFIDMPISSRLLYYDLGMNADDDGFVNNPRRLMRITGVSDDDIKLLITNGFVIPFDSGVIVIRHWKQNNYLRSDRYHETKCLNEKSMLNEEENGEYTLMLPSGIPYGIPDDNLRCTQYSIDKKRKEEYSIEPEQKQKNQQNKIDQIELTKDMIEPAGESFRNWIEHRQQMAAKDRLTERAASTCAKKVIEHIETDNPWSVAACIDYCVSMGWKGIFWDKLEHVDPPQKDGSVIEWDVNEFLDMGNNYD